jgi:uncharacterized membrane protein YhhN
MMFAFIHSFRHAGAGETWWLILLAVLVTIVVAVVCLAWYRLGHHGR